MAVWGSSARPANPVEGNFGLNAETGHLEVYDGSDWVVIGD